MGAMLARVCGAAAVALLLTGCGSSAETPVHHPAAATAQAFRSPVFVPMTVTFVTPKVGYVGGQLVRPGSGALGCTRTCTGGVIERTTDGGRTWTDAQLTHGPVISLTHAGDVVWATFKGCGMGCGRYTAHSVNDGRGWVLTPTRLYRVSFGTATDGWGVMPDHGYARLLDTSDGGKTWSAIASPCLKPHGTTVGWLLDYAVRASASRGWAMCVAQVAGGGNQDRAIYRTTDDGRTWQLAARAGWKHTTRGLSSYGDPAGLSFVAGGSGWLWQMPRGSSVRTTDGGATWMPVHLPDPEWTFAADGSFLNARTGFILLQDYRRHSIALMATNDGGSRRWAVVHTWHIPGL